jgi:hypothetical protein
MRRSFHLCASLILIVIYLWRFPVAEYVLSGPPLNNVDAVDVRSGNHDDPESRLARGEKLLIDCAGVFELELLNGVSDTTAAHILAAKPLLRQYRQPPQNALQAVHGLGVKKAHDLARFLDLSTPCPATVHVLSPLAPPADPTTLAARQPVQVTDDTAYAGSVHAP